MCLTMGDTRVSGEDFVDFTQPTLAPIPISVSTSSYSSISSLPAADVKSKTLKPRLPSPYGGFETDMDVAQW